MARVLGGIGTQPGPHVGIRIGRRLRDRQASVGGAGQPNRLARQPFRHAQRGGEHVDGAPLGSWAQNFPLATSRRASFSSSASANSRLRREFCSQLFEFLGSVGVHAAIGAAPVVQRRRRHSEFGGDLLAGLAFGSHLVRAAQLAHDALRGMPLPTSHNVHRPFQPDIGPQDSKTCWTHSVGTRHGLVIPHPHATACCCGPTRSSACRKSLPRRTERSSAARHCHGPLPPGVYSECRRAS